MRRAVIAAAGTAAAVVAILQYKSSGAVDPGGQPLSLGPTTTAPAAASPTTAAPQSSAAPAPPATAASGRFAGADVTFQYGELEVAITVSDGKITAVSYPIDEATDPRSQFINSQALAILTKEVLAAQGLQIDAVSGATYTSNAFAQSIQAAFAKAGR